MELCIGDVNISVNPHRAITPKGVLKFNGVVDYFDQQMLLEDLPKDLVSKMVRENSIVEISFTPINPPYGTHFTTFNYSLELAIEEAIKSLEKDGKRSDNIDGLDINDDEPFPHVNE